MPKKGSSMIRVIGLCLLAMCYVMPLNARAEDVPRFLSVGLDVPLMPLMVEDEAQAFAYDKPEGSVKTGYATVSNVTVGEARRFYDAALAGLAWRVRSRDVYVRDGVRLSLSYIVLARGALGVSFVIVPLQ